VDLWHKSVQGLQSADSLNGAVQSVEVAWLNK
jgi:hypothetical protein